MIASIVFLLEVIALAVLAIAFLSTTVPSYLFRQANDGKIWHGWPVVYLLVLSALMLVGIVAMAAFDQSLRSST